MPPITQPFNPSSTPGDILDLFEPEPENQTEKTEQALGFLALEMVDMAASILPINSPDSFANGDEALLSLLIFEQNGAPAQDLVDCVKPILKKFPDHAKIIEIAILYFVDNEDYQDGIKLLEPYKKLRCWTGNRSSTLHNLACCAAHTGNHSLALALIIETIDRSPCPGSVLVDRQLDPLWLHYFDTQSISRKDSEHLTSNTLNRAITAAKAGRTAATICVYTQKNLLPEKFNPHIRRSINGQLDIQRNAPQPIIREFRQWVADSREKSITLVSNSIKQAQDLQGISK